VFAPIPAGSVAWSDRRLRGAWIALGLTALVALAFFPRVMTNADEYNYAGQARMLLHGRLVPIDGDPIPASLGHLDGAVRYPEGWPILLAVGALAGFRGMFLVPLAMHLLAGAVVGRMLVRRGLQSWLAAVYLFHPVFWSYSRTLTSDVPTAAFFLLAMDAWEERKTIRAGLAAGYSVVMRIASVTALFGFGLAILPELRARWRTAVAVGLGAAVGCAVVLGVNVMVHGDPVRSPYSAQGAAVISTEMFGENTLLYAAGLLLIPPCPLLWLAWAPKRCERWAVAALPIIAFFLAYAYHETSRRWVETLVAGQRLILIAHAILLVSTASVWARVPLLRRPWLVLAGGVFFAVAECFAVRHLEQRYLPAAEALRACAPQSVGYNTNASRVVLSTDVPSYRVVDEREPIGLADVVMVAPRMPTNRAMTVTTTYELPPSLRDLLPTKCRQLGEFYLFDLSGGCPPRGAPCSPPE
jgi:hypothetical protein